MRTKNYRSREKARIFLNLLSDPAVAVYGKGNYLTANDALEELIGLRRKKLIGNPFFKLNIFTQETKVLLENLKKRLSVLPGDSLPKLFSPLFTTKEHRMGFSLAICKRIVESHGGTITVKTAVNEGTTFTVTLPIKPKIARAKLEVKKHG